MGGEEKTIYTPSLQIALAIASEADLKVNF